jgi:DNA helicase-2/ATP-dependent DNA helicase PcrA
VSAATDPFEGLDPEQAAVVAAVEGPVVVLAGAGTGKTRAITRRIAYACLSGAHDPRRSLAVTFTTRAAGEMRGRLAALGVGEVQARTFHSAALRQLRHFWPRVVGGEFPRLIDRKAALVAEAAGQCGIPTDPAIIRDLAAEIEWAKLTRTTAAGYAEAIARAGRSGLDGVSASDVAKLYGRYDDILIDRGLRDMEDVLLLTVGMLETRPDVAAEVKSAYRWFTVDEYQDVNPLQQRLLELWLGERDDVCVVGDASQTIYSFAGADPKYLLGFEKRYRNSTVIRLVRSYRSTPQIVAVANDILASAQGAAASAGVTLVAQRPAGPVPEVVTHDDETVEASWVARHVKSLIKQGYAPREIAVLYRINAQSRAFEAALSDANIPYVVRGAERFFDRADVKRAITLLRGSAKAGVSADVPAAVRDVVSGLGHGTAPSPDSGAATRERWEALQALVDAAEQFVALNPTATLTEFVADLDVRATHSDAPVADGVTLASLHSAKGLEWRAVILVGVVEGLLPHAQATTPEHIEEERRLFYVGVTRAAESLTLSWARARQPGQRASRTPSRFLAAIGTSSHGAPEVGGVTKKGRGATRERGPRSRNIAKCRVCGKGLVTGHERVLGRCRTCPVAMDDALYNRLVSWRLAESRARSVPAYVVFTDATLQAVAEQQPADVEALADVPGVGPTKLDRYGASVLALVAGGDIESALELSGSNEAGNPAL